MIKVIYEDEEVLLVHKKSGIAVQTKRTGEKDMVSLLKNYRAENGEEPYIGVVHRLDQPVEGVMVFAKTPGANSSLSRQVSGGKLEKQYLALCLLPGETVKTGEEYTLTDYLLKDGKNNCSLVVKPGVSGGKKAVLSYKFLCQKEGLGEVFIRLYTGRHHQIRVQMSHAGYPLAGDRKYGGEAAFAAAEGNPIALCAVKIGFTHPKTLKRMEFSVVPENPIFRKVSDVG